MAAAHRLSSELSTGCGCQQVGHSLGREPGLSPARPGPASGQCCCARLLPRGRAALRGERAAVCAVSGSLTPAGQFPGTGGRSCPVAASSFNVRPGRTERRARPVFRGLPSLQRLPFVDKQGRSPFGEISEQPQTPRQAVFPRPVTGPRPDPLPALPPGHGCSHVEPWVGVHEEVTRHFPTCWPRVEAMLSPPSVTPGLPEPPLGSISSHGKPLGPALPQSRWIRSL